MTIIPQDAQRLLVGNAPIDPVLEHSCNQSGWIMHFRNRAEQAEQQLVIQTERANDLEVRLDALREIKNSAESEVQRLENELNTAYRCVELSQQQLNDEIYERQKMEFALRIDGSGLQMAWDEISDLKQGLDDLAKRAQEAERLLEIASDGADGQHQRAERLERELERAQDEISDLSQGIKDLVYRTEFADLRSEALLESRNRLSEGTSVETAKLLHSLTQQLDQAKAHTKIYREQADTLQRCFEVAWRERRLWVAEAQRAQAEVIRQAKQAAQSHKRLEAWVDLCQELEPFKDRAEADGYMLLEATKRQLAGEIE